MTEADFEARVTALTEDMYRVAATLLRGHHDRQVRCRNASGRPGAICVICATMRLSGPG